MGITLGDVLRWDIMEEARAITDSFNADTTVENITIMEAPDIGKWVDGNVIVLTGLYAIYGDKRKIAEFVDSLRLGRVCALFIKVNRFVDEVPRDIVECCQKLGIAVVEIPGHIRYIDIMYPVIAAIFDSQVVQLSYHKQTLNALTGSALGNKGIRSIVQVFADIVKNPVVLYDSDEKLLCATNEAFAERQESRDLSEGTTGDLAYTVRQTLFAGQAQPLRQVVLPVRVFGCTKACLSIVEACHPTTELDFIALESAVTVLSFELVKDFAEEEVEGRFKQEIIHDIQMNQNLDTIKDRLAGIGLSANAKYNVLIIEMPADPILKTPAIVKQQLVNHSAAKVHDLYLAAKNKLHLAGFESRQANTITAFIEQPGKSRQHGGATLKSLCREILDGVAQALPDFPLHIGYTATFRDILHTSELHKDAQNALRVSRVLYGDNSCCNYDELGIYKILCLVRDRQEMAGYVPASVRALAEYEQNSGLPLLETLASYFENNGNVQQTAKALFVHYKTLQYRMHKIQDIAGVDLKDSVKVLEMQMGLNILRMLEQTPA